MQSQIFEALYVTPINCGGNYVPLDLQTPTVEPAYQQVRLLSEG